MNKIYHIISKLSAKFKKMAYGLTNDEEAINDSVQELMLYFLTINPKVLMENGPHVISKGEGIYVYDNSGKKFIEGMSGLWCASLGFSEKQLVDAALKQMNTLPFYHSFAGKVPDVSAELSEKLV